MPHPSRSRWIFRPRCVDRLLGVAEQESRRRQRELPENLARGKPLKRFDTPCGAPRSRAGYLRLHSQLSRNRLRVEQPPIEARC
jgi:hypothetical protein